VIIRWSAEARRRGKIVDAWWRASTGSPHLFAEELLEVFELLVANPRMGQPYPSRRKRELRAVLMPKTQQYLYYAPDFSKGEIEVVTIWVLLGAANQSCSATPSRFSPCPCFATLGSTMQLESASATKSAPGRRAQKGAAAQKSRLGIESKSCPLFALRSVAQEANTLLENLDPRAETASGKTSSSTTTSAPAASRSTRAAA
jgi:plasmid stabilization system protein ParE